MPDIGFFSIETHFINAGLSPDGPMQNIENALETNNSVLTTEKLERNPYRCNLMPGVMITIKGFCRSQMFPQEIACARGWGPHVELIAILVNDEILPLDDGPYMTWDYEHWLGLGEMYYSRLLVEIQGWRFPGHASPRLNVFHCRFHEGDQHGYGFKPELSPIDAQCQKFEKILTEK
jgi:hypothetical protein